MEEQLSHLPTQNQADSAHTGTLASVTRSLISMVFHTWVWGLETPCHEFPPEA